MPLAARLGRERERQRIGTRQLGAVAEVAEDPLRAVRIARALGVDLVDLVK